MPCSSLRCLVELDFDQCEFAQMKNSLKFLPKDFTALMTLFTIFLHYAVNLLFQHTSYSLALKYSSFSVLHFTILISGSKSVKFAQKFCIFLKFLTLEGTLVKDVRVVCYVHDVNGWSYGQSYDSHLTYVTGGC